MPGRHNDRTKEHSDRLYAELSNTDSGELRACIERATAIGINHNLTELLPEGKALALIADIEQSLIDCALRNRSSRGGW
jgi:hypothetical protein